MPWSAAPTAAGSRSRHWPQQGLEEETDAHAVGARADILMTIVMDDVQTDRVLRGPQGAACGDAARLGRADHEHRGAGLLSRPGQSSSSTRYRRARLSGQRRHHGAEAGTLSLLTGGETEALERCRGPLEAIGQIFHCGDVCMGQVMKLANNGIAIAAGAILWEARNLVRTHGVDVDTFRDILNQSPGRSVVSEHIHLFAPPLWGHMLDMMRKDGGLCLDVAKTSGVEMPMLARSEELDWEETTETFV
jgi:3-hydroxyisobutyrate dehydrogenase-like beta-hydroxyacid dehydrogenase